MQNLFSAYRYQRLSLSLVWTGHVRLPAEVLTKAGTGLSAEIGMPGPRAPGAQWQFAFSSEISLGECCLNLFDGLNLTTYE